MLDEQKACNTTSVVSLATLSTLQAQTRWLCIPTHHSMQHSTPFRTASTQVALPDIWPMPPMGPCMLCMPAAMPGDIRPIMPGIPAEVQHTAQQAQSSIVTISAPLAAAGGA